MHTASDISAKLPQNPVASAKSSPVPEITIAGKVYLTEFGLAQTLNKSRRTIARWEAMRMGPPRITVGKTVLYDPDKLPAWLASNETKPDVSRRSRRSAA